jgi:hypothetical protein
VAPVSIVEQQRKYAWTVSPVKSSFRPHLGWIPLLAPIALRVNTAALPLKSVLSAALDSTVAFPPRFAWIVLLESSWSTPKQESKLTHALLAQLGSTPL